MKRENKLFNTFTKNYDLKKYLESIDEKEIPSVRTPSHRHAFLDLVR